MYEFEDEVLALVSFADLAFVLFGLVEPPYEVSGPADLVPFESLVPFEALVPFESLVPFEPFEAG